ncbi:alpha-amylase family protein [Acidicapsa ligni]|uniref:alpha-amylase family glycosyl hydrolase n=1 Tax=Acidicapsa ligni TaxID=542300 RepID=UPI0021DF8710|nr:alpha-amylase family glycosyl hydrolase [Acidicapsa ligni]
MEFHISRTIREKLDFDGLLFSYTGNVIFANVPASRKLAALLNAAQLKDAGSEAANPINAGALFAMGLIDELNHALVARYREEIDPAVLSDALRWFAEKLGAAEVERLLTTFVGDFPAVAVYQGQLTAAEWLSRSSDGLPNREAALEELMLLWLTNINPAFTPFRDLFDDSNLQTQSPYPGVTSALPDYLSTRPPFSAEVGSLFEALSAPMLASPDSITGQLEFIRERWPKYLGQDLSRVLLAIDVLREEDVAIWMRFHPPGPDQYRHGAPTWGGEGFIGDEFVGFDQDFSPEYIVGPDGVRHRRYATDYQAPLNEYEAFSADQAWMPNVVLIAKSTYVWLEQLSQKYERHIYHLDHIPDAELRLLSDRGITGLWLIGLWERSTASRTIKRLRGQGDAVASAYSLKEYNIAEDLGGPAAYSNLRDRAAALGIRLASDMVPNHMGIDSPWVIEHPEWFISRPESPFPVYSFTGPDISPDSRVEIKIEDHYYDQTDAAVAFRVRYHHDGATRFIYHGNDGTSFAWNDTAQLDYSKAYVREHVIQVILHVARQFPIIRFDAAMVLAKRHVQRLWFPLPGAGGSIPSRAENAVSQEEFDALMPHEFWREVVDRVAIEVPGTLLLAEAFWLLEGYFVRTLGMHRVYNSAFMNMLRDEENAKYRSYLKKTIEFDPDILKRYVNFMSNPDERTAIDQFGSGDKYFGTCTLLATLPGLPMFGHGQIEGYTERYGMEFKQAKLKEYPNEGLEARHQHDIAPLLKNRRLFAESSNFVLYDFWTEHGTVDENVFVYSNLLHDQRAIVFYNNRYEGTRGSIHASVAAMDKASGELRQTSLSEGLALPADDSLFVAYRDISSGLEFLRRASDLHHHGMSLELRGYQYVVLLHWRQLRASADQPWDALWSALEGRGVYSMDEALSKLRLRPLHEELREAVSAKNAQLFAEIAAELAQADSNTEEEPTSLSSIGAPAVPSTKNEEAATSLKTIEPVLESPLDARLDTELDTRPDIRLDAYLEQSRQCFSKIMERASREIEAAARIHKTETPNTTRVSSTPGSLPQHPASSGSKNSDDLLRSYEEQCEALTAAVLQLPQLATHFSTSLPTGFASLLPGHDPLQTKAQSWAPAIAWILLQAIPAPGIHTSLFDQLHLRSALGDALSSVGMEGEQRWRAAAYVRVLLLLSDHPSISIDSPDLWSDPDVRWLTGVNQASEKTYFNKEQFTELLGWLQLPLLVKIAHLKTGQADAIQAIELAASSALQAANGAGYNLDLYLNPTQKEPVVKA